MCIRDRDQSFCLDHHTLLPQSNKIRYSGVCLRRPLFLPVQFAFPGGTVKLPLQIVSTVPIHMNRLGRILIAEFQERLLVLIQQQDFHLTFGQLGIQRKCENPVFIKTPHVPDPSGAGIQLYLVSGFSGQEHKQNRFDTFRGRNCAQIVRQPLKLHAYLPPGISKISPWKHFSSRQQYQKSKKQRCDSLSFLLMVQMSLNWQFHKNGHNPTKTKTTCPAGGEPT